MARRQRLIGLVGLAAVVAVGLSVVPAAGAAPSDGRASRMLPVTVSPNTGLRDDQEVSVAGSGFTGGARLAVAMCTIGAATGGISNCDTSDYDLVTANPDGTVAATYRVRRIIFTDADGRVDCAGVPGFCIVVAANISDYDESGGAPLTFDATVPPPRPPALRLDPEGGFVDGQTIEVRGRRFEPGEYPGVTQCAVRRGELLRESCVYGEESEGSSEVGPRGRFRTTFRLDRLLFRRDRAIDCAESVGRCVLLSESYPTRRTVRAALAFDDSVPPPPLPALNVEPSAGLVDQQEVTVTGTGFRAGDFAAVQQCVHPRPGRPGSTCAYDPDEDDDGGVSGPVDDNGRFSVTVRLERFLYTGRGSEVDCAEEVGRCQLRTGEFGNGRPAQLDLGFDPDAPAPLPRLVVEPASGLARGQAVRLTGTGLRANGHRSVVVCAAGPAPSYRSCDPRTRLDLPVGEDGTVDTSARARRRLETGGGQVDCADPPGCVLASGWPFGLGRRTTVALGFDPDLPKVPLPRIAVTPATGLIDGQTVTVTGTGFLPGRPAEVQQCGNRPGGEEDVYPAACATSVEVTPAADGSFSVELPVRRILAGFDELDCAPTRNRCAIQASNGEPTTRSTVLTFDRSQPRPPPPTLVVEPASGLADRQLVRVTGSGFEPGAEVEVAQCGRRRGGGRRECAQVVGSGTVDAEGGLDLQARVRRRAGFDRQVDCALARRCSLATGRRPSSVGTSRRSSAPIRFQRGLPPLPPPTVDVQPSAGLSDGEEVTVTGAGFTPNAEEVAVLMCPSPTEGATVDTRRCDTSVFEFVEAAADGTVSVRYPVRATIRTQDGTLDCTGPGTPCAVALSEPDYQDASARPVGFAPTG